MNKREVARLLRKNLTAAIRSLPDDVEYKSVSIFYSLSRKGDNDGSK